MRLRCFETERLWDWEVVWLWGFGTKKLWNREVVWLWGFETKKLWNREIVWLWGFETEIICDREFVILKAERLRCCCFCKIQKRGNKKFGRTFSRFSDTQNQKVCKTFTILQTIDEIKCYFFRFPISWFSRSWVNLVKINDLFVPKFAKFEKISYKCFVAFFLALFKSHPYRTPHILRWKLNITITLLLWLSLCYTVVLLIKLVFYWHPVSGCRHLPGHLSESGCTCWHSLHGR